MTLVVEEAESQLTDIQLAFIVGTPIRCELPPPGHTCQCPFLAVSRWKAMCAKHGKNEMWVCAIHEEIILSGRADFCQGFAVLWLPASA